MSKVISYLKENPKFTVGAVIVLLTISIPLSGYFGSLIGKSNQKKPIDLDLGSVYTLTQIFDGFEVNVYNISSSETTTYQYSLESDYESYHQIGDVYNIGPYEPSNSFRMYYGISSEYQSDCRFQDITFILDESLEIDYSKLNIVVYGDGDLIYCNSNIKKSDLFVEFDPDVIEIIVLIF